MNEENLEVVYNSPVLNDTVDNVIQIFKNHEEEVKKLDQKKWSLEADTEELKKACQYLELEKAEIDDDIKRLKLRNLAYQKEHTNLRNSITVVKFQIEKINESIGLAKAKDLKALEEYEKAVDEITEKFRSGPASYDRKVLFEKIEEEKEKKDALIKKLEKIKESLENFNATNGLRARNDENEDLLGCLLPDSVLFCYLEVTKTLDEVISGIKDLTGCTTDDEKEF